MKIVGAGKGLSLILFVLSSPTLPVRAQQATTAAAPPAPTFFSVGQVQDKWTLVDGKGNPFYSIGLDTMRTSDATDRSGKNVYKGNADAKYGSADAWADAQQKRLREWGFNTVGAFSDEALFAKRDTPFMAFISTVNANPDFWDRVWQEKATSIISDTTKRYANDPHLVGYFVDNEVSWLINLSALYNPGSDVLVMGSYFYKEHGRVALVEFLRTRYKHPSDFIADFPDAKLPGQDWNTISWANAHLGLKVTARGKETLVEWAAVMAERYFSVVTPALLQGDPHHLNFGTKFIAGLTTGNVLQVAARYSDVISIDFYDIVLPPKSPKEQATNNGAQPDFLTLIQSLLPADQLVPNSGMLADWHKLTSKPLLIAEFSYRAADAGLPNTMPPGQPTLATQTERARAITNYANCAIDSSYIIGLHFFELIDEPAAGRFDGENSNLGIVSVSDIPYAPVVSAFQAASRLAVKRLHPDFEIAPCNAVGFEIPRQQTEELQESGASKAASNAEILQ